MILLTNELHIEVSTLKRFEKLMKGANWFWRALSLSVRDLPVATRGTISRTCNLLTMLVHQPVCEDERFGAAVILRGGESHT